jgi:hypothetical protein
MSGTVPMELNNGNIPPIPINPLTGRPRLPRLAPQGSPSMSIAITGAPSSTGTPTSTGTTNGSTGGARKNRRQRRSRRIRKHRRITRRIRTQRRRV